MVPVLGFTIKHNVPQWSRRLFKYCGI